MERSSKDEQMVTGEPQSTSPVTWELDPEDIWMSTVTIVGGLSFAVVLPTLTVLIVDLWSVGFVSLRFALQITLPDFDCTQ